MILSNEILVSTSFDIYLLGMAHLRLVAKNRCGDDELAAVIDMFAAVADVLGLDDDDRAAILNVPGMAFPLRPGRPALSSWQECRLRQVIDLGTALGLLLVSRRSAN